MPERIGLWVGGYALFAFVVFLAIIASEAYQDNTPDFGFALLLSAFWPITLWCLFWAYLGDVVRSKRKP